MPRLTTTRHDRVLAFFDDTQRLFYVIPMGHRSVIGTTDTRVDTPVHPRQRRGPRVPPRPDQRPTRPAHAADRRRRHRRALRGPAARGPAGGGDQEDAEWTSLSRKHEVERDTARAVVTVFGGKLTDCLNVGEEVAEHVEALGIPLEKDLAQLVRRASEGDPQGVLPPGPPDAPRRSCAPAPRSSRSATGCGGATGGAPSTCSRRSAPTRRWARTSWARPTTCRAELHTAAVHEMVVTLDDFMRRRSKIDLVVRATATSSASPGLAEVAQILFGKDAERRLADYVAGKAAERQAAG